ncbi:MAG: tetratricopeptide repeat protein [Planctomycetota bacterium]
MERETLFSRLVLQLGVCTHAQVREAQGRVKEGKAPSIADALQDLGYLSPKAAQQVFRAMGTPEDQIEEEAAEEEVRGEIELEAEVEGSIDEGLVDDDPSATNPPLLLHTCTQCGREVTEDEIESDRGFIFFGETYCGKCAGSAARMFRLQDARFARATRKLKLTLTPPRSAPPDAAEVVEGESEPAPPLPSPPEGKKKVKKKKKKKKKKTPSGAAAAVQETPPPLPKATSVEEIPEEEIKEIEKLLSKGKRDLARSRVIRIMKCSSTEAEAGLKKLEEEVLKAGASASRGIFGFARSLARTTSFHMNTRRKNWDRVIEEGVSWLVEDPKNVDVLNWVGIAYREEEKLDRAEKTFRRAVDAAGKNSEPLRNLADLTAQREKWDEALELYGQLLERLPGDEPALRGWFRSAKACGRDEDILKALQELIQKKPKDLLDLLEEKLALLYKNGRIQEAWKALPDLLRREKRPYHRGVVWAEKLLAEDPKNVKGWRQLGRIWERREEPKRALDTYRTALVLKPGDPTTLKRSGQLAFLLMKTGEAINQLEMLEASGKGNRELLKDLAYLLRRAGRPEDAVERFGAWVEGGETEVEVLLEYGRTLLDLDRVDEGKTVLKEAAAKGSREAAKILEDFKQSELDQVLEDHLLALGGGTGKSATRFALAQNFLERGLTGPAMAQAMAAVSPDDPGVRDEAITFLQNLYKKDPGNRRLAFFLAEFFRAQEEKEKAAEILARYTGAKSHDPEANRTLLTLYTEAERNDKALDLIERLVPLGTAYREEVQKALMQLRAEGNPDPRIPLSLARLHLDRGEVKEAVQEFNIYLPLAPETEMKLAPRMVSLYEQAGDPEGVMTWSEKTLKGEPENLVLRLGLTKRYFEHRRFGDTERHLKIVLEKDPENRTASRIQEALDEEKRAIHLKDLEVRFQKNPDDAELGLELGRELIGTDRKDEAIQILDICRADPTVGWKAMEALYSHYRTEGESRMALTFLKELMPRRRPRRDSREWREITYRMGDLYLSLADPVRAGRAFFDIFKSDPNFGNVKQKMELVELMEDILDPGRTGPPVRWYLGIGGKIEGPLDLSTVKDWIDEGRLSPDDMAWRAGFSGWKRAQEADKIGLLFKYQDSL